MPMPAPKRKYGLFVWLLALVFILGAGAALSQQFIRSHSASFYYGIANELETALTALDRLGEVGGLLEESWDKESGQVDPKRVNAAQDRLPAIRALLPDTLRTFTTSENIRLGIVGFNSDQYADYFLLVRSLFDDIRETAALMKNPDMDGLVPEQIDAAFASFRSLSAGARAEGLRWLNGLPGQEQIQTDKREQSARLEETDAAGYRARMQDVQSRRRRLLYLQSRGGYAYQLRYYSYALEEAQANRDRTAEENWNGIVALTYYLRAAMEQEAEGMDDLPTSTRIVADLKELLAGFARVFPGYGAAARGAAHFYNSVAAGTLPPADGMVIAWTDGAPPPASPRAGDILLDDTGIFLHWEDDWWRESACPPGMPEMTVWSLLVPEVDEDDDDYSESVLDWDWDEE